MLIYVYIKPRKKIYKHTQVCKEEKLYFQFLNMPIELSHPSIALDSYMAKLKYNLS